MLYFSYNDYMDYVEKEDINELRKVEETNEEYLLQDNTLIDKFNNKYQMKKFLEEKLHFFGIKNVHDIRYLRKSKDTITAKLAKKEIYLFIKIIDYIDNNISFKMLEESINIVERWEKKYKQINIRHPIVIPIVVYTGDKEWKILNKEKQCLKYIEFKNNMINFSFNFIKI